MKHKIAPGEGKARRQNQRKRALSSEHAPPESARRNAPALRGLRRPDLESWTTEELRSAATTLDTPRADEMARDELIEALLSAELSAVTGRQ